MKLRLFTLLILLAFFAGSLITFWFTSPTRSANQLVSKLTEPLSSELVAADNKLLRTAKRLTSASGFEATTQCIENWCKMWFSRGYTLNSVTRETVYVTIESKLVPRFAGIGGSILFDWQLTWEASAWKWTITTHDSNSPRAGWPVSGNFEQMDRFPQIADLPVLKDFTIAMQVQLRDRLDAIALE
jgi:hypothetical protein